MVGWPDVAGRHYPGRGTAHRVDHVDCARGGGDNPTIVVVDARSADMSVDLDTGTSLDDHAVNSRSAVRRELPIRSGRLGEPVDMFHRDHPSSPRTPSTAKRIAATHPGSTFIIVHSMGSGVTHFS